MTREEIKKAMRDTKREIVVKNLHKLLSLVEGYPEYEDCIGYAIEELEQEPVVDKIRVEILRKSYGGFELGEGFRDGYNTAMVRVLNILDKYKADKEQE